MESFFFHELTIGQTAAFDLIVTDELIRQFSEISGDYNPMHTDPVYAKETAFKRPIAHGMIGGMLFSRLVGMYLPGKYALYMSQEIVFRQPIYSGYTISVRGEIVQKIEAFKTIKIKTTVQHENTVLIDGFALVKIIM